MDGEEGFPVDLAVTRHWYALAAQQGHGLAQGDLGDMMLRGEGGPVDVAGGLRWLELCATQNCSSSETAARMLADTFEHGWHGTTPNADLAMRWRDRARELADAREAAADRFRYMSGELVRKGDRIRYHGEPGEIEFVADRLTGNQETDWFVEEFGGGIMLNARGFGAVFLEADQIADDDWLEFVSRAASTGP